MEHTLKVLAIDTASSYYRINHYPIGDFFGPVDLGLHLSGKFNSLNIGTGLLAGSIFPGSNRLIFNGFSPCWGGFYISSMGGAGLVFDNLGINLLSIHGKAPTPSVLFLNREQGEEINVEIEPVNIHDIWRNGRKGVYSLMDHVHQKYGDRYKEDPRILATGPAAISTDFGAIASTPIKKGELTFVDTWAGRGGFGTKLLRDHGIAAIIYGGTYIDEDFRDRKVADQWFQNKYQVKMSAKDLEATTKYRFDPNFKTGGTFGVNYTTLKGKMLSFNYTSIFSTEEKRISLHDNMVVNHYLKQFNEETIKPKQQKNCGEPCVAVCKKMNNEFKKDYEPYQVMGPLSGIFDQRAAEKLNHHADMYGFDAISVGGIVSWLMECLAKDYLTPGECGVSEKPDFSPEQFSLKESSGKNAKIGIGLLDAIINKTGIIDLSFGARKFARHLSRQKGKDALNCLVYTAFGRNGWMIPNQYWTPGVLAPMAIMGKYYMYYGNDFLPPRELGRTCAKRFKSELILDNLGMCRFHRNWAEEMLPEIIENVFGIKEKFLDNVSLTASRINSRNASISWETERNIDFIISFLKRKVEVDHNDDPALLDWIKKFETDKHEAALSFWYDIHKGIHESLKEF